MLYLFEHILNPLLGMSLTAAFVAVVVILLRLVLKKRAPKQVVCLLWLLVFARLLVPVMVESPISLVPPALNEVVPEQVEQVENPDLPVETPAPGNTEDTPVVPETPAPTPGNVITRPADPVVSQPGTVVPQNPTTTSPVTEEPPATELPPVLEAPSEPDVPVEPPALEDPDAAPVWMYIAPAVWLVGVGVMLVVGIGSYVKLRRQVYDAIRTADGVWEHPSLASPFILGLIRPRIYLPMGIGGQSRQFILQHERAHLRRLDHVVKPICWLALAIHWFNPLAWVAFLLMSRDVETACDESVIRKLGSEVKADYSATLLALATDKRFPAPSPLSFVEGDAKARIKNVLNFKKPALWVTIAAVVVAIIAAVCLLTDPVTPDGPDLSGYTTREEYPGLYFLEEDSSSVGKKITAWKLEDGELVLVGGYEEHMANNFDVLIHADGEPEAIWSGQDVYARFEELLAAACLEMDPNWTPSGGGDEVALTVDPSQEPELDREVRDMAVPDFLTEEQQQLYRRAYQLYIDLCHSFGPGWIDYKHHDSSTFTYEEVTVNGQTYVLADGPYARWADFSAVMHAVFTSRFWNSKNVTGDHPAYIDYDGRMAYIRLNTGSGNEEVDQSYNLAFPDTFELVSRMDDEIIFNVVGHYNDYPAADEDFLEWVESKSDHYDYVVRLPIRMIRTKDGWRVDEFYRAKSDYEQFQKEYGGETESPDYELTIHWDTLKEYIYEGETYPMEPVALQLDLPQPITFERGALLDADREEIGYMALISVDENFELDETTITQLGMFAPDGTLITHDGEGMTFSTPWIRAGYDAVAYTSGSGPDTLYTYIRVSPSFVFYLSLQGGEYLTNWERCLMTLQVESGITYDTADMTLLASLPEHELYIYKHRELLYPFLVYKGQQQQLNGTLVDTWLPVEFYPADRNGDGVEEIVIRFNQGHGTGFMEDGLLACQLADDGLKVDVHDWSDLAAHFNENVSFRITDGDTDTIQISYGGFTARDKVNGYLETVDWAMYDLTVSITGDQVHYSSIGDDTFTLSFTPGLSGYVPMAEYFRITAECTLRYTGSEFEVVEELHLVCDDLTEDELPSESTPTSDLGELFLSALDNRTTFFVPEIARDPTTTLRGLLDMLGPGMEAAQIAAVDLDLDGIKELLLWLETPSIGYGTLIFHFNDADGQVYGYVLWLRAFMEVKTDGTFTFSDSASVSGVARLSFTHGGHIMEKISYSEEDYPDRNIYYYVNKQPSTEKAFLDAFAAQQEKPDLVWTEYTPVNAEALIREHFDVTDQAPPSSLGFLGSLPSEIVTSDTFPTDPEEYYLVAELPESYVWLYARNHGQDSMLLWNGNFWWPLENRVAHTGHMNLPKLYLLKETVSTTTVAVVSEVDTGTGVGMDELVVYAMGENVVSSSHYIGMEDYVYDWRPIAKEFSENNTLVYDKETNSLTLFWNGTAYCTGTLFNELALGYDLEDGYTGKLLAGGDIIRFTPNDDGTFTATMQTAIVGRPMSIGITGFELTWNVAFTGSGFETSAPTITVTNSEQTFLKAAFPEEGIYLFALGNGGEYYYLFEDGQLHKVPGAGIMTDLDVSCQLMDLDGDGQMEIAAVGNHYAGSSSFGLLNVFDKDADGWKHYRLPSYAASDTPDYVSPFGEHDLMDDAATFTIGSDPTQVTMHLSGFDFPFTVSDEVASRNGDYYVWENGRSIAWEGDGYYLRLNGSVHRHGGQYGWPSDDCGVTFQFVCRLEYNATGTFTQIPVGVSCVLPVYSNTMTGGYHDLYAVLEDGTLLMWGEPEFTEGLIGAQYGKEPLVLMENVAAVYCGSRGTVAAVDKDGNLWALDVVDKFKGINPDISRDSPYEPVWVMGDVAMVSIDFLNTLILKRDGTLWELSGSGSNGSFTKIMDNVVNACAYGYGGYAITGEGTLWRWDLNGPEPYGPAIMEEGADWDTFRYGLNEDGSVTEQGVTISNVVQVLGYFGLQADGTLWNWGDPRDDAPPVEVLKGVKQIGVSEAGILVLKQDGTYWYSEAYGFGSYHEQPLNFIPVYPVHE